jgi:segregation and condensation protein B
MDESQTEMEQITEVPPADEQTQLAHLEAALFVANEPLPIKKLAHLAGLPDGRVARSLVKKLNEQFDEQRNAFRVELVANGYQLLTRPQFSPWLRRIHQSRVEVRLSTPALETLSIVAYRQPVLRAQVEAIRGVQSGEILRQLMERELVRITGKSDELGRPFLYGTTNRFLQVFGLRNLKDLPPIEKFIISDAEEDDEEFTEGEHSDNERNSEVIDPDEDDPINDIEEESWEEDEDDDWDEDFDSDEEWEDEEDELDDEDYDDDIEDDWEEVEDDEEYDDEEDDDWDEDEDLDDEEYEEDDDEDLE